jgi:NTP pyrophosphatase (non-canonical NTP hydrolase)
MLPSDVIKKFIEHSDGLSWTYHDSIPVAELEDTATNRSVFLDTDAISVVRKLVLSAYWHGRKYDSNEYLTPESEVAVHDVIRERERQIDMWGEDIEREELHTMYELFTILGEEVGEVARAILSMRINTPESSTIRDVYKETCEVAAVAVRLMETIQLVMFDDMDEDTYDELRNQRLEDRLNELSLRFRKVEG